MLVRSVYAACGISPNVRLIATTRHSTTMSSNNFAKMMTTAAASCCVSRSSSGMIVGNVVSRRRLLSLATPTTTTTMITTAAPARLPTIPSLSSIGGSRFYVQQQRIPIMINVKHRRKLTTPVINTTEIRRRSYRVSSNRNNNRMVGMTANYHTLLPTALPGAMKSSIRLSSRRGGSVFIGQYQCPRLLPNHLSIVSWQSCVGSHAVTYYTNSAGGGKPPFRPGGGSRLAQGAGLLGAASVLFGKTKYLLAALKVTKLASLGSMLITVGTYSIFFGWPYAVGMVGLIFVHEMGHALVMHSRGIPFSPAVFVPFMGAVIATKQLPRDAWEDALIAAGGPALGSLGAGAVAIAAHTTNSQLLFALADFGFMINLFNLLPIGSMDGGRIAGALSPYAGVAGLGIGGLMAYEGMIHNPIFYLILLAGGYETFQRFYNPSQFTPPNYYKITPVQRVAITSGYFGLITALLVAMGANQHYKKPPEVLIRERELEKSWDMR